MKKVNLYTYEGQFVVEVVVPPWSRDPEVYLWGTRVFLRREDGLYREARGAFAIPPGQAHVMSAAAAQEAQGAPDRPDVPWSEKPKATTDGQPPEDGDWSGPAPKPIDPKTGQHGAYYVLPEEERRKGFVRPVRTAYVHVGRPVRGTFRDLTDEEKEKHSQFNYARFEIYPEEMSPRTGRFWTQEELDRKGGGCGSRTEMSRALAETYARDPSYYGKTFCCACKQHFDVGPEGEFVWEGTQERVGS